MSTAMSALECVPRNQLDRMVHTVTHPTIWRYTDLLTAHNRLSYLACCSCRFITETDRAQVVETLRVLKPNMYLSFSISYAIKPRQVASIVYVVVYLS